MNENLKGNVVFIGYIFFLFLLLFDDLRKFQEFSTDTPESSRIEIASPEIANSKIPRI